MKYLPIGYADFSRIIKENRLYVDKTKYIHRLITEGSIYFLSRPRRFGKSLLISTLYEIFKGNKELFKGLYIYDTDYDWEEYPIIRIDFSKKNVEKETDLKDYIKRQLDEIGKNYDVVLKDLPYEEKFSLLINSLYKKYNKPVVVLIDEYDKPILDNIEDLSLAKKTREVLKGFYGIVKSEGAHIKFVFLTGVSKFSKTGVFSGLNNLNDITMNAKYSAMLGITQEELLTYFDEHIDRLSDATGITDRSELLNQIERWYNGYCFSKNCIRVYNPFSLLLLFDNNDFSNFWFETGTPTFLIKLIKDKQINVSEFEDLWVGGAAFSSYEIESLDVIPLLVQTGYLTIKDYNPKRRLFKLYYPNYEVEESFTEVLLKEYSYIDKTLKFIYL